MTQDTKDWIKLVAQVLGTGAAVVVTSVMGGLKPWLAVLQGLGVAGAAVYQALSAPPGTKAEASEPPPTKTGSTVVLWLLLVGLSVGGIAGSPLLLGGCAAAPPRSAMVYYSFKDTWTLAHTAYGGWCERVATGKITREKELAVDAAWNKFRAAFKVSLQAATMNWQAASPEGLKDLANELNDLIHQL